MSGNILTKENSRYGTHVLLLKDCYLLTLLWLHIVASDVGPESGWAECCTANMNDDVKATEIANPQVAVFWDIYMGIVFLLLHKKQLKMTGIYYMCLWVRRLKMTWAGPLLQISEVWNRGVSWAAFYLETNRGALLPTSFRFWQKLFPKGWGHSLRPGFLQVVTGGCLWFFLCRQSTWIACFLMTHGAGFQLQCARISLDFTWLCASHCCNFLILFGSAIYQVTSTFWNRGFVWGWDSSEFTTGHVENSSLYLEQWSCQLLFLKSLHVRLIL
jgi:hypothetical protein